MRSFLMTKSTLNRIATSSSFFFVFVRESTHFQFRMNVETLHFTVEYYCFYFVALFDFRLKYWWQIWWGIDGSIAFSIDGPLINLVRTMRKTKGFCIIHVEWFRVSTTCSSKSFKRSKFTRKRDTSMKNIKYSQKKIISHSKIDAIYDAILGQTFPMCVSRINRWKVSEFVLFVNYILSKIHYDL